MSRKVVEKLDDFKQLKGLLPTEWDRKNIQNLLNQYEAAFPGQIAWCTKKSREETSRVRKLNAIAKSAKQPTFERRFSMPQPLLIELKKAYPMIISDRYQFEWFMKNFPGFDLTR